MPTRQLDQAELCEVVKIAVAALNERQRMAVLLNKFEHLSYEEIAEVMQMSPSAVKSLLTRARANLSDQRVALSPFLPSDFELQQAAAQSSDDAASASDPKHPLELTLDDAQFQKQTEKFGLHEQGDVKQIGNWQDVKDIVTWEFDAPEGVYDVWLNYAHQGGGSFVRTAR